MKFKNLDSPGRHSDNSNLQILNRVRLIAINTQIALILVAVFYLDIRLPVIWLSSIIIIEIILQCYSYFRVKYSPIIYANEVFIHIIIDSLILAGLVYFTGGANNPFIYLLLLSVALGTLMLTPRNLLIVSAIQLLLYSLLNIYQRPLELGTESPLASFHLHLAGMWINFVITVLLIAIFGLLARHSMLKQEKKIQLMREKQLKDEQILALGIMSAGAAHEMGTPLSTMAIVVDDLQNQSLPDLVNKDLELLMLQISNCRKIIQSLATKSHQAQVSLQEKNNKQTEQSGLKKRFIQVIENWLVYRPEIELQQNWDKNIAEINFNFPISIEQAVTNLLDNAADASIANQSKIVSILFYISNNNLIIEIHDRGKGMSSELSQSIGAQLQETKKQNGLGWGLFLTNASIERVKGNVELVENKYGGTLTRVCLPLK